MSGVEWFCLGLALGAVAEAVRRDLVRTWRRRRAARP